MGGHEMKKIILWYKEWKNKKIQERIERERIEDEKLMKTIGIIVKSIFAVYEIIKEEQK
jgi:hypothetical protein